MKYYYTVPIYYTNGAPHIGHTYTTLVADTLRRYQRLIGNTPAFTTGTDEHGVNVERAARNMGKSPKDFVDTIAEEFRMHWDKLGIQADYFVRTSSEEHQKTVQWMFDQCRKNGFVYKGHYTGAYCVSDNLFATEAKPGEPCPICGRILEAVTEENFFFKLSAFQDKLIELYERHPEFIQPDARRNEVMSFVKGGLTDLSITRTGISWGIPVPGESPHVFYVWFDALIAYFTAAGGANWHDRGQWPADLHLVGKEIIRFHAVYWPAFLMAAGLPLPKQIWAHGWLLFDNDKMSKTKGNVVRPLPIAEVMGFDALRYYLLREVVFGQDGNFGYEALVTRYNADLANGLGNLASRTLSMIHQYRGGKIPQSDGDQHIAQQATETIEFVLEAYGKFEFNRALERVWTLISAADKLIVERAPWKLVKESSSAELLDRTLYSVAEVLRICCGLLTPVLPESVAKIWHQMGFETESDSVEARQLHWGHFPAGQQLRPTAAVFPRLDVKATVEKLIEGELAERARQDVLLGRTPSAAVVEEAKDTTPLSPEITIDDFVKVDLRVGKVLEAASVKGADKLLHLKVDIGEAEPRSIVAGIALAYKPEQLVGRKVVIVANLAPRKLRGLTSQGMIVAASVEGGLPVLAGFNEDIPVGARVEVTLVDSHCHLDGKTFNNDRDAAIQRAIDAGVTHMVAIGTGEGPPDLEAGLRLADRYTCFSATVGVHPHDASKVTPETFPRLQELLRHPKCVALGEIGLDYHYDFSPRDTQRAVFVEQMKIAAAARKPIIIHTREAWADTMDLLREHWSPTGLGCLLHCFTGGPDQAKEAVSMGFHLAFGGVLTYPKAEEVRQAARETPLDRILLETDAPYLSPIPHRGKRNEPAYVALTAAKLAEVRGLDVREIAQATTANTRRLLNWEIY